MADMDGFERSMLLAVRMHVLQSMLTQSLVHAWAKQCPELHKQQEL
jgi:hypothetical protein